MRTRKARGAAVRSAASKPLLQPEVGRPFRVGGVTPTRLAEVIEDYVMTQSPDGFSVSGELFFQPVPNRNARGLNPLSTATSWQLQLEEKMDGEQEDEVSQDMLLHAMGNYHYHLKRNVVKMRS